MTYQICIDGERYEESDHQEEAQHLYDTLDETCLSHYYGHKKSLVCNDTEVDSSIIQPQHSEKNGKVNNF
jgi:hypothetical protein